jgi:MFS family permease
MSSDAVEELGGPETQEQAPVKMVLPIYALFTGNIISYIGNTLTLLAIPWFVLQTTGRVEQAGLVGFFSLISTIASSFFTSVLVERVGYRRTSVVGDLLSGGTVLLIPLLYHTLGLAFWELLILVFVGGLLRAPANTARATLVPNLAELAEMRLERANSFDEGISRMSVLVGAPLTGVLIAFLGPSNLLWLDAASFVCSALIIGLFVPAHLSIKKRGKARARAAEKKGYFASLAEGMSFTRDPILLTLLIVFIVINMLASASSAVVMPAYMLQTYHSAIPFGLIYAAFSGMGFVGTIVYGFIGHRLPRRLTLCICVILSGTVRFWILLIPNFPIQFVSFALAGLLFGPINPLIFTVIQERTPRDRLARVMGVGSAMVMGGMPLGALFSGFVVIWIGMGQTLLAMGAIYLLATLAIVLNPQFKQMERGVALAADASGTPAPTGAGS